MRLAAQAWGDVGEAGVVGVRAWAIGSNSFPSFYDWMYMCCPWRRLHLPELRGRRRKDRAGDAGVVRLEGTWDH